MSDKFNYNSLFIELGASLASSSPVRNIIEKYNPEVIEEFRKKYNNTDVFTSIFWYNNQEIREGKQIGPLYFDLDGEYAQDDTSDLIDFFNKYGCPKESIRVYFSGNKGFHLEIPFEALDIEPIKQLNKVFEIIAKEIKSLCHFPSLDTAIYDAVRLWRLPNSINSKSGLFKIPLKIDEVKYPSDKIKELAKNPRLDFAYSQPLLWKEFKEIFEKAKRIIDKVKPKSGVFDPVEEGARNDATFRRAIRLKGEGKTFEQAVKICSEIQDKPPLSLSEIKRTVASAYHEKYLVEPPGGKKTKKDENQIFTSFIVTGEGLVCEEVYDSNLGEPLFAVYDEINTKYVASLQDKGKTIKPINDNTVTSGVVKLPTKVVEYGDDVNLFNKIKQFIHTYVDINEEWGNWSSYYVLLSWVYDKLPVCPYLCALGPSDSGKTRFVQTIGNICYKPFTASGSITAAPIFRILDKFKGTLIINEFDHIGEFNAEIVVVLNNGYEAGLPAVRVVGEEEKQVQVFHVFGPKLFSARKRKSDWAFESRLLTVQMKETKRKDIPPFLLDVFHTEAQEIRNMLLMFRFRHYKEPVKIHTDLFPNIKGRLRQTLLSITSVIHDEAFLETAKEFAKRQEEKLKTIKGFDLDAVVYQILQDYWQEGENKPQLNEIVKKVKEITGIEKITSRGIGNIVRDELGFETNRGGPKGNYVALLFEEQLSNLKDRYGVSAEEKIFDTTSPLQSSVTSGSSVGSVPTTEGAELTEGDKRDSNSERKGYTNEELENNIDQLEFKTEG